MPDDLDYQQFFHRLAHPEAWSPRDRELMEFSVREQRQAVVDAHPKALKQRADLVAIVEQIESALRRYDDLQI